MLREGSDLAPCCSSYRGSFFCHCSLILGVLFLAPEPSGRVFNLGGSTSAWWWVQLMHPLFPNAVYDASLRSLLSWIQMIQQCYPGLVSLHSLGGLSLSGVSQDSGRLSGGSCPGAGQGISRCFCLLSLETPAHFLSCLCQWYGSHCCL